jgi:hypothetical protein
MAWRGKKAHLKDVLCRKAKNKKKTLTIRSQQGKKPFHSAVTPSLRT